MEGGREGGREQREGWREGGNQGKEGWCEGGSEWEWRKGGRVRWGWEGGWRQLAKKGRNEGERGRRKLVEDGGGRKGGSNGGVKGGARDGGREEGARPEGKRQGRYPGEDTGQYTAYRAQNNPQPGPCPWDFGITNKKWWTGNNNNSTLLQTRWTYRQVHGSCPIHSNYIAYTSTASV